VVIGENDRAAVEGQEKIVKVKQHYVVIVYPIPSHIYRQCQPVLDT